MSIKSYLRRTCRPPEPPHTPGISPTPSFTTYHPYAQSPSALTEYLKHKLCLQCTKRLSRSHPAQVKQNIPLEHNNGMYQVSRSHRNGQRLASIIPLTDVCLSVQLFPVFGQIAPQNWQSSTVLEECCTFYVNPFLDRHMYYNLNVIKDNL